MTALEDLFAQGAKEVQQEIWTEQDAEVPMEERRGPGHEYHFRLRVRRKDDGQFSVDHSYLGYRKKEANNGLA